MDVMQELIDAGAVYLDRHFVYVSGKHGPGYINPDMIFPDLRLLRALCELLAEPFREDGVSVVVGAATGGIPLAVLTALNFGVPLMGYPPALWADKKGDGFAFERAGFADELRNERVLVVEDLLTTGGSIAKVCREVEKNDGMIVGVSAICNRGGVTAEQLGVPRLESLAEVNFKAYEAHLCPHCEALEPIVTDVGHGAAFQLDNPRYMGGYVKLLAA